MARNLIHTDKVVEELKVIREQLSTSCFKMVDGELKVCSRAYVEAGMVDHCNVYAFPNEKWRLGDCPMADEFLRTETEQVKAARVRVGQQKQKKKARRQRG